MRDSKNTGKTRRNRNGNNNDRTKAVRKCGVKTVCGGGETMSQKKIIKTNSDKRYIALLQEIRYSRALNFKLHGLSLAVLFFSLAPICYLFALTLGSLGFWMGEAMFLILGVFTFSLVITRYTRTK